MKNSVYKKIENKILSPENKDKIWSYSDFKDLPFSSTAKALSLLYKKGVLKKVQKSYYYLSKKTILGDVNLDSTLLITKKLQDKNVYFCISGINGYNKIGLTTQISKKITISCDCSCRSNDTVKFQHRKKPHSGTEIERIILDAINDLDNIPGTTADEVLFKIKDFIRNQKVLINEMGYSALNESPRVKAIVGALGEEFCMDEKILTAIRDTLKTSTYYYLSTIKSLKYASNWNIKEKRKNNNRDIIALLNGVHMYENKFAQNDEYKAQIDTFRPLSQDVLSQIQDYYKIGLTYSSNALEGNTLDLAETKVVLEDGLTIGGKPMKDHLEALGHAKAFQELFNLVGENSITEEDIKKLHYLFYNKIDEVNAGQYRKKQVIITGSDVEFPRPEVLDSAMKDFIEQIPQLKKELHPVAYAAMIHIIFVNINPFIDGNGRVARLLMNLALLQEGYNIVIIPPVVRSNYIRALQDSNKKNYEPFINFISEMVLESQKEYLRIIERLS